MVTLCLLGLSTSVFSLFTWEDRDITLLLYISSSLLIGILGNIFLLWSAVKKDRNRVRLLTSVAYIDAALLMGMYTGSGYIDILYYVYEECYFNYGLIYTAIELTILIRIVADGNVVRTILTEFAYIRAYFFYNNFTEDK